MKSSYRSRNQIGDRRIKLSIENLVDAPLRGSVPDREIQVGDREIQLTIATNITRHL
ncbi:MAG: hypothetical protein QNJ54_28120 [Prochloraceae cyanobacterium]|nr:hypothetical protein [Prochloraceae cyanobacterium]